ncbi:UDP-forming cellulose synthase catalytic subunit [Acinetobacter qingfengensis]|nr:UDP-forming cellulose synthase catalytic subunit [Acinetobacter qingfengensis]
MMTVIMIQPISTTGLIWLNLIAISFSLFVGYFGKQKKRFATLIVLFISLLMSLRYMWWRVSSTLEFPDFLSTVFGMLLLTAEIYSWAVLFIAFFQCLSPLKRESVALPEDQSLWPTVDVFIPTYNEDIEIVRITVYAALGLVWPKDKIKIYILDDGHRESFRQFAIDTGVEYIARETHEHAKAGNLNHALKHSHGDYIAIFDCDHVANQDFLSRTMGFFLQDKNLALVQTPHHFFSPDPFERNLNLHSKIPSEGALFYGIIQDGNDTYNATFFCGSCAVIKRDPLLEIGGIAVETVTEDAHTALKLHRKGYNSAYLRYPLAAGLATETLSSHIGQRIRWARGMIQILRLDCPFLGRGLTFAQRICYFSAMLHYLSSVSRIIFLLAPLAFLFFHSYIIYAPAIMVLLYVFPHLFLSIYVNSLIQGKYRHSFWGEVYETILSFYTLIPTVVALFAPHKGKFNVTAKGGLIQNKFFDYKIASPFFITSLILMIGVITGLYRIFTGPEDEILTVCLSLIWCFYNLLILGICLYVSIEKKQIRSAHRIIMDLDAQCIDNTGEIYNCKVINFSANGLGLLLNKNQKLTNEQLIVKVILNNQGNFYEFPVRQKNRRINQIGVLLDDLSANEWINYISCTFGRPNIWDKWQKELPEDNIPKNMILFIQVAIRGYRALYKHLRNKLDAKILKVFDGRKI